ncbi:MAG: N-6 DNA methylase, partial [Nitrososphaerales archaeon]
IKNFLEADYFAWYLEEWNDYIATSIFEVIKKLLDYEPATVELSPEKVKDLFKRLYQNLVPRDIRHRLGEYFTPDWLAELLLDEVGYDGDPEKKILDPACGSGTFLVLAIKRIKEYAEEHFLDKRELLTKIVENVQGIDLNPLAVLAAKANYLIALADLIRYRPKEGIELPVYLADSIAVGRRSHLFQEEVYLKTVEGELWIPREVLDKGLLSRVLEDIDSCIKTKYSEEEFRKFIQKYALSDFTITSLTKLYSKLLSLEKEGRNRIWTRILKNSFAPLLIGKFDFVIGNPPWINWENLPEFYRNSTKELWNKYGLIEMTEGIGLRGIKRDIATLFVARCFDQYTNENGILSFLIPYNVIKTQGAAGFRNFLTNKCEVTIVHELSELHPFEGATNRTGLLVIKHGKTNFPIKCKVWSYHKSGGISQEAELSEVNKITKQFSMDLAPIETTKPKSPWILVTKKSLDVIKKVVKESDYRGYEGSLNALNGVYLINILSNLKNKLLVENLAEGGKRSVKKVKTTVDIDLVYPLVRGKDTKRWYSKHFKYIIFPHDPKTGEPFKEDQLKIGYPDTYKYFLNFKDVLKARKIKPFLGSTKSNYPFYMVDNTGKRTFEPFKVIWKDISGKISAKGEFGGATVLSPIEDIIGKNIPIVDVTLFFIPCKNSDEAHYICSILNSSITQFIVTSYAVIHVSTQILKYLGIKKFNPEDKLHLKLSELSKKAHELAKRYYEQNDLVAWEELKKVEEEIDKTVAELYGITENELDEIKKCLIILKEGEVQEEEEAEEEMLPKEEGIEVSLEPLLINENRSQEISVKLTNDFNSDIEDLNLKISLKDKTIMSEEVKKIERSGERNLKFSCPALKAGQYNLKIELTFSINGERRKVEEERMLFVKAISKKMPTAFGDLDKLFGD